MQKIALFERLFFSFWSHLWFNIQEMYNVRLHKIHFYSLIMVTLVFC